MDKESLPDEQKQWIQEIVNRKVTIPENIMMAGVFIAGSGLMVFAMELLRYLESGVRTKWSMLSIVENLLPKDLSMWLSAPESWWGLHKLVMEVLMADTGLVLLVVGMATYWLGSLFDV